MDLPASSFSDSVEVWSESGLAIEIGDTFSWKNPALLPAGLYLTTITTFPFLFQSIPTPINLVAFHKSWLKWPAPLQ